MNGIILLAFDCSNRWSSIGLWADGRPAAEFNADMGRRQASELPCATQKLLQTKGWAISDLNALAVTVGPGYFTGIRIGMAYAAGLACALGIDIVPLSSLEVLLRSLPQWDTGVKVPLIAASRERVFSAAWRDGVPLLPEKERSRDELLSELGECAPQAELWAADDPRLFASGGRESVKFVECPSGAAAAQLARENIDKSIKPDGLRARYLREPGLGRSL